MARLIDADKISYERAHLIYPDGSECLGYRAVVSSVKIKAAPTVDAVEVIRCKDCKHLMFSDLYGECKRGNLGIVKPDDFCSYGERKDGDGNG